MRLGICVLIAMAGLSGALHAGPGNDCKDAGGGAAAAWMLFEAADCAHEDSAICDQLSWEFAVQTAAQDECTVWGISTAPEPTVTVTVDGAGRRR